MGTFIENATAKQIKEARDLGNIVAKVDGGVMVFDSIDAYKTWKRQK